MKVILNQNVEGLGSVGDVVDVKDGYARNFLIPRNLVITATLKNVKVVESVTPGTLRRIPDRGPGVPQVYAYITEHGGTPGLFGWFWVKQWDGQTCTYVWRETWLPVTKKGDTIIFPEKLPGYHPNVEVKDFPAHPSQYKPKPNALPRPQPLPELKKPVPLPPRPPVHPAPPPTPKEVKPPTSAPTLSPPKVAMNHRVWNWSVGKNRLAESNPEAIAAGIRQRQAAKSLRPTATGQTNR